MRISQEVYVPYCRMAASSVDNLAGHAFLIMVEIAAAKMAEDRREGSR